MNYSGLMNVATRLQHGDIEAVYDQLCKIENLAVGVVEHPDQNRLRALLFGVQSCRYAIGVMYENQVRQTEDSEGIARLYEWSD